MVWGNPYGIMSDGSPVYLGGGTYGSIYGWTNRRNATQHGGAQRHMTFCNATRRRTTPHDNRAFGSAIQVARHGSDKTIHSSFISRPDQVLLSDHDCSSNTKKIHRHYLSGCLGNAPLVIPSTISLTQFTSNE